MTTVAVDVMSGDCDVHERLRGALAVLRDHDELHVLLVGQSDVIEPDVAQWPASLRPRVEIVPASQVVSMDARPRDAIRRHRDSSMRVTIDLVRAGRAVACVSAGNTGALNAMSHFVLKTIGAIERAAIMSAIPSAGGHTHMLDLGANTGATAKQLYQFATMGAIVARDIYGIQRPRIGLLNIGEEGIKGDEIVQAANGLLASTPGLDYIGFVEGDDIFSGAVDVVVTDGFTGNVALKAMEGLAHLISQRVKVEFEASLRDRLAAWASRPALRRVAEQLDPRRYDGACMVGLTGVVVKSHGRADAVAFARAITLAALAVRQGLTQHLARAFQA